MARGRSPDAGRRRHRPRRRPWRIDELTDRGLLDSAAEEAMLALQSAPTYLALHKRMADIMLKAGRTEQAIEKLRVIAETYIIRGDGAQSIEIFTTILTHSPVDIPIRLRRSICSASRTRQRCTVHSSSQAVQADGRDRRRKTLAEAPCAAQRSGVDRQRSVEILHQMATSTCRASTGARCASTSRCGRSIRPTTRRGTTSST
jgi:hypothetical protein